MDKDPPSSSQKGSSLQRIWSELKRRHVMRVAGVYVVVAWLIIQIASATFEGFGIPEWAFRFVVIMVTLGFPVALIIAWAFELTPQGIKTTRSSREADAVGAPPVAFSRKRKWLAYATGAAAPTLIFSILAIFFYFRSGSDSFESSDSSEKSIAVLPLVNMSPDPENAFFADGVHEDVLTNLSKIKELLVIGRTSTLQYRDTVKTLQQIGEELGVRYLVEGSVRRAREQVLVTVQLIDTHTGGHLWAENYHRKLDDIFAIQADMAKDIAGQLHAAISPEEIERIEYRPTESQEAYEYWVKHRQLTESPDLGNWDAKIEYLERAVELDPDFFEAWAHLSIEYIVQWAYAKFHNDPDVFAKAHQAIKKAERLSPGAAYVLYGRGYVEGYTQGGVGADQNLFLDALTKDPSFYRAHRGLAGEFFDQGRLAEAQHHIEAFLRTDPLSKRSNSHLLEVYLSRRMLDQARGLIEDNLKRSNDDAYWQAKSAELNYLKNGDRIAFSARMRSIPEFSEDRFPKVRQPLLERDYSAALQAIENEDVDRDEPYFYFIDNPGGYFYLNPLDLVTALIHFEIGDQEQWAIKAEEAKTYLEEIVNNDRITAPFPFADLAICYALLGDREMAESTIERLRKLNSEYAHKYMSQVASEFHIAIAYLVLGDHDKAMETLEAANKIASPIFLNRELDLWFIFDRLRGDPRFDALLKG